jgi:FkbM family methyltransferase
MAENSELIRAAIRRSAGLRMAVESRPVQWTIQTMRGASAVRPAPRFIANQCRSTHARRYRLRGSRLAVILRHRSRDVAILNEIFGGTGRLNCYAPPSEIAAWLDGLTSPRIMDLGANIGLFGLYAFGRWPTASLTAFEPDPNNAILLHRTIAANDLGRRWTVNSSACSNRAGTVSFVAGLLSESRMAETDEIGTMDVPMVDLFAEDHDVHLMKIDIEGAEWPILADARMPDLKARAIVLEWHTGGCPETDPHAAAIRLLRAAGYSRTLDVGDLSARAGNGVTWAWRPGLAVRR